MIRFPLLPPAILCVLILACSTFAFADTRKGVAPTLASALSRLPRSQVLTIAVGADKVSPSKGQVLPDQWNTASDLATDFGMTPQTFGNVTAIAPATTFQYNETPTDPNPFENMDANTLIPIFLGTLDDTQWKSLTGSRGLGLADLSTDLQRSLFLALFPQHQLKIAPNPMVTESGLRKMVEDLQKGISPDDGVTQDLTDRLPVARLHLGLSAGFRLPCDSGVPGKPRYVGAGDGIAAGSLPRYHFARSLKQDTGDRLFGIRVRTRVPNSLKGGDLDWSLPALTKEVTVADAKTVNAVMSRIAAATGLEIMADRLIGKRTFTATTENGTASAGDLLKALAVCVSGTYRRVGSAYVLTDNQIGRAVLRQRWVDVEDQVNVLTAAASRDASRNASRRHSASELPILPGVVAPSPGQIKAEALGMPGEVHNYPFKDLPATQQDAVRQSAAQLSATNKVMPLGEPLPLLPETKITVEVSPALVVDVPGLEGSLTFSEVDLSGYLQPSMTAQVDTGTPASPPITVVPKPREPLTTLVQPMPHRTVLAQPRTLAEVDTLIASMHTLGLNELWLDVFSDGKVRTALLGEHESSIPDILGEALKVGAAAGIHVVPTLDLWLWGKDAPDAVRDRNMYGEDSIDADSRRMRISGERNGETEAGAPQPPIPGRVSVSPTSPAVSSRLKSLIKTLVATPGIDAMIWRETDPAGYRVRDTGNTATIDDLGYTDDLRAGFLAQSLMDPIDIVPNEYAKIDRFLREGVDLPGEDYEDKAWRKYRAGAKLHALQALAAEAKTAAGPNRAFTIILRQDGYNRNGTGWYGSWDDTKSPVPVYHSPWHIPAEDLFSPTPAKRPGNAADQAKAQSTIALYLVPPANTYDAATLAEDLKANVVGKPWDGFVLDLRGDSARFEETAEYPANPLKAFMPPSAH